MRIRITGCTDPSLWYSDCVGQEFEEIDDSFFDGTVLVVDKEGLKNIVYMKDVECVMSKAWT